MLLIPSTRMQASMSCMTSAVQEGVHKANRRTCLLELAHIGIHKRQASLAILPPLKSTRILVPSHFVSSDAVFSKQLVAMLLSEESASKQTNRGLDFPGLGYYMTVNAIIHGLVSLVT